MALLDITIPSFFGVYSTLFIVLSGALMIKSYYGSRKIGHEDVYITIFSFLLGLVIFAIFSIIIIPVIYLFANLAPATSLYYLNSSIIGNVWNLTNNNSLFLIILALGFSLLILPETLLLISRILKPVDMLERVDAPHTYISIGLIVLSPVIIISGIYSIISIILNFLGNNQGIFLFSFIKTSIYFWISFIIFIILLFLFKRFSRYIRLVSNSFFAYISLFTIIAFFALVIYSAIFARPTVYSQSLQAINSTVIINSGGQISIDSHLNPSEQLSVLTPVNITEFIQFSGLDFIILPENKSFNLSKAILPVSNTISVQSCFNFICNVSNKSYGEPYLLIINQKQSYAYMEAMLNLNISNSNIPFLNVSENNSCTTYPCVLNLTIKPENAKSVNLNFISIEYPFLYHFNLTNVNYDHSNCAKWGSGFSCQNINIGNNQNLFSNINGVLKRNDTLVLTFQVNNKTT
jgi:hypothetical protein